MAMILAYFLLFLPGAFAPNQAVAHNVEANSISALDCEAGKRAYRVLQIAIENSNGSDVTGLTKIQNALSVSTIYW